MRCNLFVLSVFRVFLATALLYAAMPSAWAQAEDPGEVSTAQVQQLESQLADLEAYYEELTQDRAELEPQYEALQGSRMLHQILQEQRASLRQFRREDLEDTLAQLRLELFHVQRELRNQPSSAAGAAELSTQLERLEADISLLVSFMQVQTQLTQELNEFEQSITDYLFWTPSNHSINWQWFIALPERASEQAGRLINALHQVMVQWSVQTTGFMMVLIAALILLLIKRSALQARLKTYNQDVAANHASSPWLVPSALLLHALLVAPASIAVLIAAQFINAPVGQGIDLDRALNAVAGALFMVNFLARILRRQGFAELYFRWQPLACQLLSRFVHRLGWVLVPLSFVLAVASQQSVQLGSDVLGQLLLALASVYLLAILLALFARLPPLYGSKGLHRLVAGALLVLPSVLLLLVVTGYYYTALMLSGYYLATLYLISTWLLTAAGVQRALDFAYEREQERIVLQAAAEEQADLSQPNLDELRAQLTESRLQAQRLARFGLLVVFGFILFQVWSEATMALDYLDSQLLWANAETGASALSVGGLVTALVIAVVGIVLVRNLPGLLEMTILSRLQLQMGTAYAVTSLVNYVVISIAIIAFLASLGVRWDQLQWLAAGLTVGLGFGLQEIFGNFISGLILFFERPVRVGDIVTLDTLSGRVTQIRIRAIVIKDFDGRDIIVPNRQFITGQFINWSLSNTMTRIIVKVGVAYGSDLEKTREILFEVARNEPRVATDPEPTVVFMQFGASTLDHELRVHVAELSDRMPTIDALNREIDRRFKDAGVEIAFNQIDVHFRNELGIERQITSSS